MDESVDGEEERVPDMLPFGRIVSGRLPCSMVRPWSARLGVGRALRLTRCERWACSGSSSPSTRWSTAGDRLCFGRYQHALPNSNRATALVKLRRPALEVSEGGSYFSVSAMLCSKAEQYREPKGQSTSICRGDPHATRCAAYNRLQVSRQASTGRF